MNKADFEYEVVNGVLCIIDLNLGNMSVTNDIENVLRFIKRKQQRIYPISVEHVIYRDSDGIWDQIIFGKGTGEFISFQSINVTDQQEAIRIAKSRAGYIKRLE